MIEYFCPAVYPLKKIQLQRRKWNRSSESFFLVFLLLRSAKWSFLSSGDSHTVKIDLLFLYCKASCPRTNRSKMCPLWNTGICSGCLSGTSFMCLVDIWIGTAFVISHFSFLHIKCNLYWEWKDITRINSEALLIF